VKVIILDNGQLGLVRQQQELFYGRKFIATSFRTHTDFSTIASGFGIRGIDMNAARIDMAQLESALKEPGPCLVNINISGEYNVYPMVPPGKENINMLTEDMHE